MKSFIFAAILLIAFSTNSSANDINVPKAAIQNFKMNFGSVSNVNWTVIDKMYRAEFILDDEKKIAFFHIKDGSLLVTCHYITTKELTRSLRKSLQSESKDGTLTELYELEDSEGVNYYATIIKADATIILKADGSTWRVYKKK